MRRALAYLLLGLIGLAGFGVYVVGTEPDWYLQLRYPLHYETIIDAHADNYGLPPSLVASVIFAESGFDPQAESSAGAIGLMQLLPDTAQGIADHTGGGNYTTADLYDPENMPTDLREAHERNDEVLERIYIGRRFKNDTERLEKLFEMYTKMTASSPNNTGAV